MSKLTAQRRSAARFHRVRADHQDEISQDYVELIAELIDEHGEARGSDVAKRLGVSNATVVKTLRRLQENDLVAQEPYRAIFLTESGQKLAEEVRRRHRIVEDFLVMLGVSREVARVDAEGLEHHVSKETLDAMERFIREKR